jgi:hypothetical protein
LMIRERSNAVFGDFVCFFGLIIANIAI